ncbi:MAG TPA: HAMP domain-containing sensor histidine kinase [Thermogutta sp.]|nr:HAMP domain-containing sensor histidine kinase [Thermogutta sp.]
MKLSLWHHLWRPITRQILGSMILISVLSSLIASLGMGLIWSAQIKNRYREELRRVCEIIKHGGFPLHRTVLAQLSGLSGMEFISLSTRGAVIDSTLKLSNEDEGLLAALVAKHGNADSSSHPRSLNLGGTHYQIVIVSVLAARGGAAPIDRVIVLQEETALLRELQQVVLPTLLATVAAVVIGFLLSIGIARHISQPLVSLTEQTIKAAHDLQSDIALPKTDDETHALAEAIQRLITERRGYEQSVRQEARLQAAHQFALGLGHQLRNLLTALRMAIELHAERCHVNRNDEDLLVALRQVRLIDSVLRQFLSLRAFAELEKEPLDYAQVLESVLDLLRPAFQHAGVQLRVEMPQKPCVVTGHRASLEQLTTNLVMNALEAVQGVRDEPVVTVALRRSEEGVIQLVVEDNGPGPPASVAKDLLKKPVTSKSDGIGLGLFVAQLIAEQHNGRIIWRRENGRTQFVFELPNHS